MEVLFHFVFELIKIAILSSIYGLLIVVIFKLIALLKPDGWFDRVSKKKLQLWFFSGLIISVGLFIFMFTYFGDHGLGDSSRVPIGHFKVIRQINGVYTYLQNDKGDQLGINNFLVDKDNLYAEIEPEFSAKMGNYVIWNLRTDQWTFLRTRDDYVIAAKQYKYPSPDSFEDFWTFYNSYWNSWRFWTLP